MICYLVHGFNVKDAGAGTVDRLVPHLTHAGFKCIELDYGYFNLLRVRLCNKAVARTIAAKAFSPAMMCPKSSRENVSRAS